jgi:hypothetical protein
LSDPKQKHASHEQNESHVKVHGAIEAHLPEGLLKKHDAERKEDSATHIAERTEDRGRETKKLLLDLLTLIAVTVYAAITFWQAILTRMAIKDSREYFTKGERPYVWNSAVQPRNMIPNQRISADIHFVNYGKSPALEAHGIGKMFFGKDALKQAYDWFDSLGNKALDKAVAGSTSIIPPGIPADPQKTDVFTTILSDNIATQNDITYIVGTDFSAVIALREQYSDTSGNIYYSDMCLFHFASNAIGECKEHNKMH